MSPEQARGKPVDRRADIWAFGVVLFEMLSGRRAFDGETTSDVLAKVIEREPDWRALPSATPTRLRELLRRSLKKDPKARLRDIGEARVQIEELLSGAPEEVGVPAIPHTPSLWQRALPWASAGALAIALALIATAVIALRRAGDVTPAAGPAQFTIAPPENTSFGGPPGGGTGIATQVAVSPDGRNIVFVAGAPPALPDLAATSRRPGRTADSGNRRRDVPLLVARQSVHRVLRGWQTEESRRSPADPRSCCVTRRPGAAGVGVATTCFCSRQGAPGHAASSACPARAGCRPSSRPLIRRPEKTPTGGRTFCPMAGTSSTPQ